MKIEIIVLSIFLLLLLDTGADQEDTLPLWAIARPKTREPSDSVRLDSVVTSCCAVRSIHSGRAGK